MVTGEHYIRRDVKGKCDVTIREVLSCPASVQDILFFSFELLRRQVRFGIISQPKRLWAGDHSA